VSMARQGMLQQGAATLRLIAAMLGQPQLRAVEAVAARAQAEVERFHQMPGLRGRIAR